MLWGGGNVGLMEIRRGLMAQMANGAQFVKGTFTVSDSGSSYTLNFGKTFSKYMYFVEMTDESKTAFISSGATAARIFCYVGIYPKREINNTSVNSNKLIVRLNPSTSETSASYSSSFTESSTSIVFATSSVTGSTANALYKGYTYNYYIVEIK